MGNRIDKHKTYTKIETKHVIAGDKTSEFEWEREPIVIKVKPMRAGDALAATVFRFLPKVDHEKVAVRYTFACFKRSGEWRCSPDLIPDSKERQRHIRRLGKRNRRDWCRTVEANCAAAEKKMANDSQAQEQVFASDAKKLKITAACNLASCQTFAYWYSLGWLVCEVHNGSGQRWIWPEAEFASIEAARARVESELAPKPMPFLMDEFEPDPMFQNGEL